mgnify:CR=1 FL=1
MWVFIPSALRASFPGTADSTSASNLDSLPSDAPLVQSCTVNGKPMPLQSWQRAWKTAPYLRRLSGATLPPSQQDAFTDWWTSRLAASPAKTSATPAGAPDSCPEPEAGCGSTLPDAFARWDAATSSLRMLALSWDADLTLFSEPLPKAGSMRNGSLYRRQPWALPTAGNESSSWRSPTAGVIGKGGPQHPDKRKAGGHTIDLQDQAAYWPTPAAMNPNDGESVESWQARVVLLKEKHGNGNGAGTPLAIAAQMWPTPNASEVSNSDTLLKSGDGRETPNKLGWAVQLWQTPSVADGTGGHLSRGGERSDELLLRGQAKALMQWATPMASDGVKPSAGNRADADLTHQASKWPTPQASDGTFPEKTPEQWQQRRLQKKAENPNLGDLHLGLGTMALAFSLPDPATPPDGEPSLNGGPTLRRRLNPRFVEWLQGLPIGWTNPSMPIEHSAFEHWEMVSFRSRQWSGF